MYLRVVCTSWKYSIVLLYNSVSPIAQIGYLLYLTYCVHVHIPCGLNGDASTRAARDLTLADSVPPVVFCSAERRVWADLRLLARRLMELAVSWLAVTSVDAVCVQICVCTCVYVHFCIDFVYMYVCMCGGIDL